MASAAERRRQVLQAIVADYTATQEPVGSKALLERHKFDVSSATIRNDMAALEAEGYISQQHASSGRLPTQKAYRLFVDSLNEVKPLSQAERRAILNFLEDGVNLEDVLRRSVQLLSQLTRQTAVVQLPNLKVSRVKHCEVVSLTPTRLLLVLITDTGRVDQRHVELDHICGPEHTAALRDVLNHALDDKTFSEASIVLTDLIQPATYPNLDPLAQQHLIQCVTVLIETLVEPANDRLILAGQSHLAQIARDFPAGLPTILEALEEQVIILKLLTNIQDLDHVSVLIGDETKDAQLRGASVVATGYGAQGAALGGLGVVGPTYMDYSGTMSKVHAVAQYVSWVLSGSVM